MRDRAPEAAGAALLLLAAGAAAVLLAGGSPRPAREAGARAFHGATGGLGSGTALSLDACGAALDASLDGACGAGTGAVPGGFAFCPHHAGPTIRH